PFDADHPERHGGDEDRGQAARQRLFRPDDAAVSKPDEKHAEHRQRPPMRGRRDDLPADFEYREDHRAGNRPPESRHEERRNRLNSDANGEVSRPPQEAHGHPGKIGGPFGSRRQIAILRLLDFSDPYIPRIWIELLHGPKVFFKESHNDAGGTSPIAVWP